MRKWIAVVSLALVLSGCVVARYLDPQLDDLMTKAEAGDANSEYSLGLRYLSGSGVEQNYIKAADWFERAAQQSHIKSAYMLGVAYDTGRGRVVDDKQAYYWYLLAAQSEHDRAEYQVAEALANGRGVEQNMREAYRWYQKAALHGNAQAAFSFGVLQATSTSSSASADEIDAWAWLNLAEQLGHKQAGEALARLTPRLSARELHLAKSRYATIQGQVAR